MVFVSGDKLHKTAAPYILGDEQAFVWAPDLKAELARLGAHFLNCIVPIQPDTAIFSDRRRRERATENTFRLRVIDEEGMHVG
jgi:hypothetical protein